MTNTKGNCVKSPLCCCLLCVVSYFCTSHIISISMKMHVGRPSLSMLCLGLRQRSSPEWNKKQRVGEGEENVFGNIFNVRAEGEGSEVTTRERTLWVGWRKKSEYKNYTQRRRRRNRMHIRKKIVFTRYIISKYYTTLFLSWLHRRALYISFFQCLKNINFQFQCCRSAASVTRIVQRRANNTQPRFIDIHDVVVTMLPDELNYLGNIFIIIRAARTKEKREQAEIRAADYSGIFTLAQCIIQTIFISRF